MSEQQAQMSPPKVQSIPAATAANMAQGALQFLQRCDMKGGEADAFLQVRAFLVEIANGRYDLTPVE